MSISVRGTLAGNTAQTNATTFSPSLTTGWTGSPPQSGDLVLVVGMVLGTSNQTWSQTAGTGTWTLHSTGDQNHSGGGVRSFAASRVFDGTETNPTFTSSSSNRIGWVMIALTPSAGATISIDTWATTLLGTTLGTSFTPNAATAAGSGEVSVIINGATASAKGSASVTITDSTGWTQQISTSAAGTGSSFAYSLDAAVQTGVSGTVTPGAEGTSETAALNAYHVLVTETGGGGTGGNVAGVAASITINGGIGTPVGGGGVAGLAASVTVDAGQGTPAGGANVGGVATSVAAAAGAGAPAGGASLTGLAASVAVSGQPGTVAGGADVSGVAASVVVGAGIGTPAGGSGGSANVAGVAAQVAVAGQPGTPSGGAQVSGVAATVTVTAQAGTPAAGGNVVGLAASIVVGAGVGIPSGAAIQLSLDPSMASGVVQLTIWGGVVSQDDNGGSVDTDSFGGNITDPQEGVGGSVHME